jgi:threonylcarbamoyladenosine tRNA methylthiotransferase MtaB
VRVAIHTLGCKVNQYETQAMETLLQARGHTLVPFEAEADAYIINTCTVTAVSDRKSRQMIRRAKARGTGAVVAVCGCYPQTHPEEAAAFEVDLWMGTHDRSGFVERLENMVQQRSAPLQDVDNAMQRRVFERLPSGGLAGRTRAMLKVEDGCVNFCTYCIIPYARGPVRSLPLADAAAAAKSLAAEGYRELVLTGIELSSWGMDLSAGEGLADLIEAVCTAAPALRVRLGSLEPRTITEDFCRRISTLPNLCPHFHLSLQSGCDATLQRMGRRYDTCRYRQSVEELRAAFGPDMGLTTDVIVGFPGETEEEFSATLDFLQDMSFSALHVFPYSVRPGTPAARMEGQVPKPIKEDRAKRAGAVARSLQAQFFQRLVGKTFPVLFEEEKDGLWRGHAPNYVEVYAPGTELHNVLRPVLITGSTENGLTGRIESEHR